MHRIPYSIIFYAFILQLGAQDSLSIYKQELIHVDKLGDSVRVLDLIASNYIGAGKLNRDSLKKYNDVLIRIVTKETYPEVRLDAKQRNLIARYRLPFEEYRVLANDLISDLKEVGDDESAINELFYLAKKAQTAGLEVAFELYEQGLEEIASDDLDLADADKCQLEARYLSSYSSCWEYNGQYDKALQTINNAVTVAEQCGDSLSMLRCYRSAGAIIGIITNRTSFDTSLLDLIDRSLIDYLELTYDFAESLEPALIFPLAAYNLAYYHYDNDSLELAEEYLNTSLATPNIEWMPMQRYYSQTLMSDLRWKQGDKAESYEYLIKGVQSAQELNEERHDFMSKLDMANWYYQDSQYNKALISLEGLSNMMTHNLDLQLKFNQKKYMIHEALGQYSLALHHSKEFATLQDSMRQQEISSQIESLLNQKEKAERSNELALLKAENLRYKLNQRTIVFISLIVLGLLGLLWYRSSYRSRQRVIEGEKAIVQMEQKLFRSQMNPHFIFNTLGSIQSFLLDKNKSKEAAYFMAKFAKLMRQILSQSQRSTIPLQEELDTLNNYLLLQKMRFKDKFDFTIEVDDHIQIEEINIPPMLLQPVVENAIEHGKVHLVNDGLIRVGFKLIDGLLQVEISDNGVGIKEKKSEFKTKESVALSIIKERLNYLSKQFGQNIDMFFQTPSYGNGTTVVFNLPSIL